MAEAKTVHSSFVVGGGLRIKIYMLQLWLIKITGF